MKCLLIFIGTFLSIYNLFGQISHGGQPLFPKSLLKSASENRYIEMPSFDVAAQLKEDLVNEQNGLKGFRFAYKFYTDIERGKDGTTHLLPDGTKVWQVGIRSAGAYSINVLFSEFHIPEGAKLFLYNSTRTCIVGSFTHENNADDGLLPVRPVMGDELIVEYSEPPYVAFEGRLKIAEVNHDYRNLFAYEPKTDQSDFLCMPDVVCRVPDDPNIRSALLLIINGDMACSGTLLNNASGDGCPYVLTASHCLNDNFRTRDPNDYVNAAGTIVSFFNYKRTVCATDFKMKGVEEMSLAGSSSVCIIDTCDIALIRLNDTPPDYYMPYYAGWDITYNQTNKRQENAPFTSLHYPGASVLKYGQCTQALPLTSFTVALSNNVRFLTSSHWRVNAWQTGATAGGSSGSGLFNHDGRLIGALSGGSSECVGVNPTNLSDFYFALFKGWEYGDEEAGRLRHFLDPDNSGATALDGLDPYKDNPVYLLSNIDYNGTDSLVNTPIKAPASGRLFGHNSLAEITEFAEAFFTAEKAKLTGAYILAPSVELNESSEIKISVYAGGLAPENKVASTVFYPKYLTYQDGDTTLLPRESRWYPFMSFVRFEDEPKVNGQFFIAYEITYPYTTPAAFSVYNAYPGLSNTREVSTAWLKKNTGEWMPSSAYTAQPVRTSLAIQAAIRQDLDSSNHPVVVPEQSDVIRYDRSDGRLYLNAHPDETGTVSVYAATGQLMRRFAFSGSASFPISLFNLRGAIGIVRMISNERNASAKIIF
ncbi:MAG: S1 family peptidase [Dysgonamonadaceae bacterium]|jgi:hypothetical protein|nr:S1 family peptidase [Dysgonamonadaceae bacterium]